MVSTDVRQPGWYIRYVVRPRRTVSSPWGLHNSCKDTWLLFFLPLLCANVCGLKP